MNPVPASLPIVFLEAMTFLVGCCIGSFLNVVIYRLPKKESLIRPGSHCPHCGRAIMFYDNLPILSYLVLGGKCRYCRDRISARYPLVEGITGLLSLLLFRMYGLHPQFFIELLFVYLLIAITFIDFDTQLIPDVLSVPGMAIGLAASFFTPRLTWLDSVSGVLLGGGLFYLVAVGYEYLRHQEGLGGGDIKLLGMIGAFVGLLGVVFTIMVSSLVGTVVGLAVMWRSRQGLATKLPFGPFLALGAVCYIFWGQSFFKWYFESLM